MSTFKGLALVLFSIIHATFASDFYTGQAANSLTDRQSCPADSDICEADNGRAICQFAGTVCCQASGIIPFLCPEEYPYCCDYNLQTGIYLCGARSDCGAQVYTLRSTAFVTVTASQPATKTSAAPTSKTADPQTTTAPPSSGVPATSTKSSSTFDLDAFTSRFTPTPTATHTADASRVVLGFGNGYMFVAAVAGLLAVVVATWL